MNRRQLRAAKALTRKQRPYVISRNLDGLKYFQRDPSGQHLALWTDKPEQATRFSGKSIAESFAFRMIKKLPPGYFGDDLEVRAL